ncbi:hypothetical protein EWX76_03120 [Enterococcus faecium]|nr:hypothetical protein [Enterococcus faecium]
MLKETIFSVFFLQFIEKSLYFSSYSFFVTMSNGTSKKMKKQGTRYMEKKQKIILGATSALTVVILILSLFFVIRAYTKKRTDHS